mgnify:CR=1 FL=1
MVAGIILSWMILIAAMISFFAAVDVLIGYIEK